MGANALHIFFFQAEDGIRDTSVTGVQTCALPISDARLDAVSRTNGRPAVGASSRAHPTSARSEERRVGKECRSRWASYQEKKNDRHDARTLRRLSGGAVAVRTRNTRVEREGISAR